MIPVGAIIAVIRFLIICIRQSTRCTEGLARSDEQPPRNDDIVHDQEKSQVTTTLPPTVPHQIETYSPHIDAPPPYSLLPKDVSLPPSLPPRDDSPPRYITVMTQPKV